jgi:hypothetical protein
MGVAQLRPRHTLQAGAQRRPATMAQQPSEQAKLGFKMAREFFGDELVGDIESRAVRLPGR